jgi:hypothetical protein
MAYCLSSGVSFLFLGDGVCVGSFAKDSTTGLGATSGDPFGGITEESSFV